MLDRGSLPADVTLRPPSFAHELAVFESTTPDQVASRIADADIVITNKAPVRAATLASAPRLRLIAIAATGYDVVDVAACAAQGIAVSNVRNYAVNTVPEHTFALIFALRRSHCRVPAIRCGRRVAAVGAVLLLRFPDQRSRGIDAGNHRRRVARTGSCRHR